MPELPDDWHPPIRDLQEKVWAEHPERERLEELWRERDATAASASGNKCSRQSRTTRIGRNWYSSIGTMRGASESADGRPRLSTTQ